MSDDFIRLNKFLSTSGVCSRRKADILILSEKIKVNGNVVNTLGYKISKNDVVEYNGHILKSKNKKIYILFNKPFNCITTAYDPQHRKTVFDFLSNFKNKRLFPVGRLDRNTTGLLLLTNDGEMAKKLMHPSSKVVKKYSIVLDRVLSSQDEIKIKNGFTLEDGFFKVDKIQIDSRNRKFLNVEIHSGRNRILRRLFKHLNYRIIKLNRFFFAGLTCEGIKLGCYRKLIDKEIKILSDLL